MKKVITIIVALTACLLLAQSAWAPLLHQIDVTKLERARGRCTPTIYCMWHWHTKAIP